MKTKQIDPIALAKGQLWKTDDKQIEIMEVGKTLVHYRVVQNQRRVPISLGGIEMVIEHLRSNNAQLVRKGCD